MISAVLSSVLEGSNSGAGVGVGIGVLEMGILRCGDAFIFGSSVVNFRPLANVVRF